MEQWRKAYEKGRAACGRGDLNEALAAFEEAVRLNADAVEARYDMGVVLFQQGAYDLALAHFREVTELNGRIAPAWLNGGNALCAMSRHAEAIDWYRRAIDLDPDGVDGHYNLANAYKALQHPEEAILHYRRALQIDPHMPEAHNNLGTLLLGSGELERARQCFELAIAKAGDYPQATYNLGLVLNRMGRPGEAVGHVRRCLHLQPQNGDALALLVSLLQQTCDWDALKQANECLDRLTDAQLTAEQRPSESPFLNFTRDADPRRNLLISRAWSRWLSRQNAHLKLDRRFTHRHHSGKRIKVAYLSERFRNAATAHLASGIFNRHRRDRFEIHAYSWGRDDGSYYRRAVENGVDHFVDIRKMSDQEAAGRIHADGIDILVDMMGWMHGHRMGIAAQCPAPVQVSYLGYPGTTGAPFMDYLIADRSIIPEEMRQYYSEQVIWLPDCYQPNDPETPVDAGTYERASFGLPSRAFVFCSFNTDYKIAPEMFACWMNIMSTVPDSVLWLIVRSDEARTNLRRNAALRGIEPSRLVFASPLSKPKHIARMRLADLALDTLPVNGHTTTTDALLAGLPVITCRGSHFASRVASTILKAVGLDDLVTDDLQRYADLAVALAKNQDRLYQTKTRLQLNKRSHPLFDINRYVKHLESAYETIWREHVSEVSGR